MRGDGCGGCGGDVGREYVAIYFDISRFRSDLVGVRRENIQRENVERRV